MLLPMASSVFDGLCLLPSLLLLLLSLLSWGLLYCRTRLTGKAAGWRLWVIICMSAALKLDSNTITWMDEAGSPGTDILFGSGQVSDGLRLICKLTTLAKYLLQNCVSLSRLRLASWPRGDLHFQTLSSLLQKYRDRCECCGPGLWKQDWVRYLGERSIGQVEKH